MVRTSLPGILAAAACAAFAACGTNSDGGGGGGPGDASVADGDDAASDDASRSDDDTGGGPADGPPAPCSGPGANPDPWTTFGHDAARTSASNGCIHAAFTELWRYSPSTTVNDASVGLQPVNALADSAGLYVHVQWRAPTVDRISATDGSRTWRYEGGADFDASNWMTLALGYLLVVDDGVYQIDATTGKLKTSPGVDWWGDNAADANRFYLVTTTHGDGPGAFVGAWDVAKGLVWHANQQGDCSMPIGDENNAIALDGGTLFYAPWYRLGTAMGVVDGMTPVVSGVYAFDSATGAAKWSVPTTPQSAIAAAGGNVYLVEMGGALVARSQATGAVVWSTPVPEDAGVMAIGSGPPAIAAGKVIVATAQGVVAFDAATGAPAWTAHVAGAGVYNSGQGAVTFASCSAVVEPVAFGRTTRLAAATASRTLVVTAYDAVHVLSLDTGAELGTYALKAAYDPIIVGDRLYVLASGTSGAELVALQAL